jgi:hypothetical protein
MNATRRTVLAVAALALTALAGAEVGRALETGREHAAPHRLPVAPTLKDTLIALEKQSWDAWKRRDGAFYKRFLSADHVEIGASGVSNKAEVVATVSTPRCVVADFTLDHVEMTRFDARVALLTYWANQSAKCSGVPIPAPAWVSSLYVYRNGQWLNAAYQQTPETRR